VLRERRAQRHDEVARDQHTERGHRQRRNGEHDYEIEQLRIETGRMQAGECRQRRERDIK